MSVALIRAVERGSLADVVACLAAGARAAAVDQDGWSALHSAACGEDPAIAEVLLRAGAAVDGRTAAGHSPLHLAADNGRSCCRVLLSAGADVNAATNDGMTSLHRAAWAGELDCAALLLAAGADARRRWFRHTPADVAADRGHVALATLLADAAGAQARWVGLRRAALTAWCR